MKQPRAQALPGLESRPIRQLNDAAADYAEIRDERMALTTREVALRARVLALMHKHQRTKYAHHGITIELVPGEESLKVRVKAPEEPDLEAAPDGAPETPPEEEPLDDEADPDTEVDDEAEDPEAEGEAEA